MTTRTRFGITLASALALAVTNYGQAMNIATPGLERQLWDWSVLGAYALALVGVALVNRWWALLPSVVPMGVNYYLYNFTDYSTPWESESIHLSGLIGLVLAIFAIAIQAGFLSLGFLLRRAWLWARDLYRSNKGQGFGAGRLGS
jgi:hypothetical protein